MNYIVTSSRLVAGRKTGEIVSGTELDGCNIEALVAAGHLSAQVEKPTKTATSKE